MTAKISESDLAELLFPHVTDFKTWIALSKVSKKFNEVSKKKLIKKEEKYEDGYKKIWTILLRTGQKHGFQREWYPSNQLMHESNYYQGKKHGIAKGWFVNGQLSYSCNYYYDQLHGPYLGWFINGQLVSKNNYNHGKLIENSNN